MTHETNPDTNPPESGDEVLDRRTQERIRQMKREAKDDPVTKEMARRLFEERRPTMRIPEDLKDDINDFDDMLSYISLKMRDLSPRMKIGVERLVEDLVGQRGEKSVEDQIKEVVDKFGSLATLLEAAQERGQQNTRERGQMTDESREAARDVVRRLGGNPAGMTDQELRDLNERAQLDPVARRLLEQGDTPERDARAVERGLRAALGDEEDLVARVSSGIEMTVHVKDTLPGLQQWADEIITEAEGYDQDFGSSLAPTRIEEIIYVSKALKQASEHTDDPKLARSYAERAEWLSAEFEARMQFHQNYLIDKNTTEIQQIDDAGHKLIRSKYLGRIINNKKVQRVVLDLDFHGLEILAGRSDAVTYKKDEAGKDLLDEKGNKIWDENGITRGDARIRIARRIAEGKERPEDMAKVISGVNTKRVYFKDGHYITEAEARNFLASGGQEKTGENSYTRQELHAFIYAKETSDARKTLFDTDISLESDQAKEALAKLAEVIPGLEVRELSLVDLSKETGIPAYQEFVGKERLGERVADIFGQLGLQDRLRVKPGQDPKIMENPDHPDTQIEFYGEMLNGPLMRRRTINHLNWSISQRTTGFVPWHEIYDGIPLNNQGFFQLLAYEIFKEERLKYIQSKNKEWRDTHPDEVSKLTVQEIETRVAEDYNDEFMNRFYGEYEDPETGEKKKGLLYGVKRWTRQPAEHGHDAYYVREAGIPDLTWFRESLAEGSRVKRKVWKEDGWVRNKKTGKDEYRGHWEESTNSGELGQAMDDFARAFSQEETLDDQGRTALERIMSYDLSNVYEKMFSVWQNYNFVNIEKWRSQQYASENNKSFVLNPSEENLRTWINGWGYRTDDQPKMRKQAIKNLWIYNARDRNLHTGQPNLEYIQNERFLNKAVGDGIITYEQAQEAHHQAVHELYSGAPSWGIDLFLKYKKATYYFDLWAAIVSLLFEIVDEGTEYRRRRGGGGGGGGGGH